MGDRDEALQRLLHIHSLVAGDEMVEVNFDTKLLEDLIEASLKFQGEQEVPTEFPKAEPTGRRAAIAAQKARKKDAQT